MHKFTGLPSGEKITNYALNVSTLGNGTFVNTNNFQAGATNALVGNIYVHKFTGLANTATIIKFGLNVNTAAGHVRLKIYDDVGGVPTHLLGESGSLTVLGTGLQNFTMSVPITSTTIWGGFETDNNTLSLKSSGGIGNTQRAAHVYGSGPNPCSCGIGFATDFWTQVTYTVPDPNVRVKIYTDSSGPTTLLAQSNSLPLTGIGIQKIPITLTIPGSGNVWAGFETDSSALVLKSTAGIGNTQTNNTGHTYGNGPDPCGCPNGFASDFWAAIVFAQNFNFKWDGTPLTINPSVITPNSTGGFSGVTFSAPASGFGVHTVNASDTGGAFATAPFTITFTAASFNLTGYVLGPNGFFNPPRLTLISTSPANATQLWLIDNTIGVIQNKTFNPPIHLFANYTTTIPWNFTDARGITGDRNYTEEAVIQQGTAFGLVTSNVVTLHYQAFTIGKLNINQTNTNTVPIWFVRKDINASQTRVSVIFPNAANMTCNLSYQFASINRTYFNIPKVTYDATQKNSSFLFKNSTNDIITIRCRDLNTNNSGQYILTQTIFPFIQQIQQFRSGAFGTTGQFGMLDIVTLSVVIFSMIGFNRINEAVGAFFSIAIVGIVAYWGILSFPGVMAAAVAIVAVIAITSTRKTGGF